ncbi:type I-E CRISPR-associated protein Cas5/CasD [Herbidospora sp. NEAU-GS84]|uniref:Type I-E CRISPR-associated protein Cas5/CasD n=1 Tax=Herbidospora solisilvae TaxID=2696284 RepID=A0A7C9J1V5_9ACTN|nr:type I-E CRISPR-associated protein Cas5/CasD [Herbidospora solisilvae]NAS22182.1 type I-E CRISPR-associated protein Cas5/CasD [Herbidospora solisilvae]
MSGLLVRLAGPMQSWGEHSTFSERDTQRFPTRSGVIGLLAAAAGIRRGESLGRFDDLRLTIRIDRPGLPMTDFHTVGGGQPRHATVPTSEGKRRSLETATIVTRRHYLADAVFVAALTGPDDLIDDLAGHLNRPKWHLYLGRRSCPPDPPVLLGRVDNPETELRERVPVARRATPDLSLDFVMEDSRGASGAVTELLDRPENFDRLRRLYRRRTVTITPLPVPEALWAGRGRGYQDALFAYVGGIA